MTKRTRSIRASGVIRKRAQELRQKQTPAEEALWARLRGRKLDGMKFRRQHPIGRFIADFYCAEVKLIIEVDGEIHQHQKAYDQARTEALKDLRCQVIRFTNAEVDRDIEGVLMRIRQMFHSLIQVSQ